LIFLNESKNPFQIKFIKFEKKYCRRGEREDERWPTTEKRTAAEGGVGGGGG